MKAVILAAGKGTRMRELTQETPKPMLLVDGKPILEHIVLGIATAGIREFCIIVGWKAESIMNHFGDGSRLGISISYRFQEVADGTGKAPELARDFVGNEPFLLTYGDILVRPETYKAMTGRFTESKASGVITVTASEDPTKGGLLFFDDAFNLSHLVEKPSPTQLAQLSEQGWIKPNTPLWYNAGIYVLPASLFLYTAKLERSVRGEYELTDALVAMALSKIALAGLEIAGRWVDVRDPETLASLQSKIG